MTVQTIGDKTCKLCKNYGYYGVSISNRKEKMQMFCACPIGQALKRLSIEWRMNDIKVILDDILPRLRVIKNNLHEPSKAGTMVDALEKDLEGLLKKSQKALKDSSK